ncbi:MAG: PepSY-associated TM helix domain-containing protein [Planctomycetota bacterium]
MKRIKPTAIRAAVWRWHFYAGLILAPIILAVTVTGMIYIWADEWEATVNRDLFIAEHVGAKAVTIDEQVDKVREAYPDADLTLFSIGGPGRTNQVHWKTKEGYHRYVYLHPTTGEIQGTRNHNRSFMPIMRKAHRTLFLGTTGRVLIELATSWTVILLLTGVYLWWPRPLNRVAGVWLPRLKRSKPYLFWRDLHSVPSAYITVFAVIIVFTGLFYTLASGSLMKLSTYGTSEMVTQLRNPPAVSTDQPIPPASRQQIVEAVRDARGIEAMALVAPHADSDGRHITPDDYDAETPVHFDELWLVQFGNKDKPNTRGIVQVDPYSAEIVQTLDYENADAGVIVASYMYPLHVGSIFGTPTKILATLTCLLIIAMTITGIVMWWVRRPKGRSGFMPLPDRYRWPIAWWLVIVLSSVVMPVFALSLIVVALLERAIWLKKRLI